MTLQHLLDTIAHPRILVLGDLILDRYTFGNAERVSPEAPVVVLRVDSKEVRLGGAASVALLLRGLEAHVTLAGIVGEDPEGRTVQSLLRDEQIDSRLVLVDPNRPTTTKERIIGRAANRHSHQIVRVDHETRAPLSGALEEVLFAGIIDFLWGRFSTCQAAESPYSSLGSPNSRSANAPSAASAPADSRPPLAGENPGFDALLISDYAKGVCTPALLRRVIDAARDRRIPVIVDPARIADYSRYAGATLVKPNRTEAELATGLAIDSPETAFVAGEKLRDQHNIDSVLVTLDHDGMALVGNLRVAGTLRVPSSAHGVCGPPSEPSANHPGADTPGSPAETLHLPAEPREIYDITGAGDMVFAALGLCLASDLPLPQAAHVANVAAGLEVSRFGVAPITRQELALHLPPFVRGGQGGSRLEIV